IRQWNIEDGRQQGPTMQAGRCVYSIAVSQDGQWIVSGDFAKKAIVWNALTNEKVHHTQYGHWVSVCGVKFSPGGGRFATASRDYGVRVYSTHGGKVLFDSDTRGSTGSSSLVTPLAWSADGQQLFVAS
ncbi:hypothetical protein PISMIDRAFT_39607, partial [Pisolithus microcarpus 441]